MLGYSMYAPKYAATCSFEQKVISALLRDFPSILIPHWSHFLPKGHMPITNATQILILPDDGSILTIFKESKVIDGRQSRELERLSLFHH